MIPTPPPLTTTQAPDPEHPLYQFWYSGELLTPPDGNRKFLKTLEASGIRQYGLTLASAFDAGILLPNGRRFSACESSTASCRRCCTVGKSAQGKMPLVLHARIRKTLFWYYFPEAFQFRLCSEIIETSARDTANGFRSLYRLNANSDFLWSGAPHPLRRDFIFGIPQLFPWLPFEDYTAHSINRVGWTPAEIPPNWRLTFSRKNRTLDRHVIEAIEGGRNVAIVFHNVGEHYCARGAYNQQLPDSWIINGRRYPVIDGDRTDYRGEDPTPAIVGLRLKSASRQQRTDAVNSGFSVEYSPQ